jgi:hypothetical protein
LKDGMTEVQKLVDQAVQAQLPMILKVPEPDRSKALVCLAYEYFILDMEEKAFAILDKADPNYFSEGMKKDLQDPQMNQIFMTIVAKLIESGYVKVKTDDGQEGQD